MRVNPVLVERDLRFFLVRYAVAVAASFVPLRSVKVALAGALLATYGYYVWRTVRADDQGFRARLRLAPPREREYLQHGGILQYVLRRLLET